MFTPLNISIAVFVVYVIVTTVVLVKLKNKQDRNSEKIKALQGENQNQEQKITVLTKFKNDFDETLSGEAIRYITECRDKAKALREEAEGLLVQVRELTAEAHRRLGELRNDPIVKLIDDTKKAADHANKVADALMATVSEHSEKLGKLKARQENIQYEVDKLEKEVEEQESEDRRQNWAISSNAADIARVEGELRNKK